MDGYLFMIVVKLFSNIVQNNKRSSALTAPSLIEFNYPLALNRFKSLVQKDTFLNPPSSYFF